MITNKQVRDVTEMLWRTREYIFRIRDKMATTPNCAIEYRNAVNAMRKPLTDEERVRNDEWAETFINSYRQACDHLAIARTAALRIKAPSVKTLVQLAAAKKDFRKVHKAFCKTINHDRFDEL